jgi:hypothetical protein
MVARYFYLVSALEARWVADSVENSYHTRGVWGRPRIIKTIIRESGLHVRASRMLGYADKPRFTWCALTLMTPPGPHWGSLVGTPVPQMRLVGALSLATKTLITLGCHRDKARSWIQTRLATSAARPFLVHGKDAAVLRFAQSRLCPARLTACERQEHARADCHRHLAREYPTH